MTKETKKEILKTAGVIGACILAYEVLALGMSYLVSFLVNSGISPYSFNIACMYQIVYTAVCILLPFYAGFLAIKKIQNRDVSMLLMDKPNYPILFVESLGIGFMALVISNYATSFFITTLEQSGFEFEEYAMESPSTVSGFIWALLAEAIVPAMAEEFAFRGVVLQSLRKYGDWVAIIVSSFLFALLHGNMTQLPFAFLLAMVIGRLVVATGSIWTGIAIHMLNNTYSVVMNYIIDTYDTQQAVVIMVLVNLLAFIYGIVSVVWMTGYHRNKVIPAVKQGGPGSKNIRNYMSRAYLYIAVSPTMLIALIVMSVNLFDTIHWGG